VTPVLLHADMCILFCVFVCLLLLDKRYNFVTSRLGAQFGFWDDCWCTRYVFLAIIACCKHQLFVFHLLKVRSSTKVRGSQITEELKQIQSINRYN